MKRYSVKYQIVEKVKRAYDNYSVKVMAEKKNFAEWLTQRKYKKETVRVNSNYAAHYLNWLEIEKIEASEAQYQEVIAYLSFQRENEESEQLASSRLRAVRHYYQYLQYSNNDQSNPAENLFIKQHKKQLVHDVLAQELLTELYQQYPNESLREKRNKIVLGMLVHQALRKEEIQILKVHHVQLRKGELIVPPNNLNNGRTIRLAADQILDLQEYLLVVRPQILKANNQETDQLFISLNGSLQLKSTLYHLIKELRKEYEELNGCRQIRMSVITHWLREKDIREVQYLAGFRHLDSLEYYQKYHTGELGEELKKYHPLK